MEKPSCRNCLTYGVQCFYLSIQSIQLIPNVEGQLTIPRAGQSLARANVANMVARGIGLANSSGQQASQIAAFIHDFQTSIVLTIGSPPIVAVYQREIVRLALSVSY